MPAWREVIADSNLTDTDIRAQRGWMSVPKANTQEMGLTFNPKYLCFSSGCAHVDKHVTHTRVHLLCNGADF